MKSPELTGGPRAGRSLGGATRGLREPHVGVQLCRSVGMKPRWHQHLFEKVLAPTESS